MSKYLNRKEIDGTPFAVVGNDEEWTIAIGNQLVTEEKFTSEEEAYAYVMKRPWDLILNVTALYTDYRIKQLNTQNNGTN